MKNNHLADISTFESIQNQANVSFGNSPMSAFQADVPITNTIIWKTNPKIDPNDQQKIDSLKKNLEEIEKKYQQKRNEAIKKKQEAETKIYELKQQLENINKNTDKASDQIEITKKLQKANIEQFTSSEEIHKIVVEFGQNTKSITSKLAKYGITYGVEHVQGFVK